MRILSISLDQRVLDPQSAVHHRQTAYFIGHEVSFIVLEDKSRPKFLTLISALRKAWKAKGVDLVTAQDPFFCGFFPSIAAKRSGAAFQIQDHSGAFARQPFGWKEWLLRPISLSILRQAARIRTVSQRGKRGLMSLGIQEEKIDVIPILGNLDPFLSIERNPIPKQLLCVARLEKEKGIDVLLFAMAILLKQVPDAKLEIVGDGSMKRRLESLRDRLGLHDAVSFAGKIDQPLQKFAAAEVYVQPSYFEGWGMAAVEAAASGLPVVMTDTGCAGEIIIDQKNGLIVPPADASQLADTMELLLRDKEKAEALGRAGRELVKGYLSGLGDPVHEVREAFERTIASHQDHG